MRSDIVPGGIFPYYETARPREQAAQATGR